MQPLSAARQSLIIYYIRFIYLFSPSQTKMPHWYLFQPTSHTIQTQNSRAVYFFSAFTFSCSNVHLTLLLTPSSKLTNGLYPNLFFALLMS